MWGVNYLCVFLLTACRWQWKYERVLITAIAATDPQGLFVKFTCMELVEKRATYFYEIWARYCYKRMSTYLTLKSDENNGHFT